MNKFTRPDWHDHRHFFNVHPAMQSGLHITANEALILLAFLTLIIGGITLVVARRQLEFLRKQDETNKLLLELSSRTSAVLCVGTFGSLGVMNVGQIDVYLYFAVIDNGAPILFEEPIYLPPAGADFYRQFGVNANDTLAAGDHKVKIFLKDALNRKWVLDGTITKRENSKGINETTTISLKKHDWGHPPNSLSN